MNEANLPEPSSPMERFGRILAIYKGTGRDKDASGSIACTFIAAQFMTGDILVQYRPEDGEALHSTTTLRFGLSDPEESFVIDGCTTDGLFLHASGNPMHEFTDSHIGVSFRELHVYRPESSGAKELRYGITNFECRGPTMKEISPQHFVSVLPLNLRSDETVTSVTIVPLAETHAELKVRRSKLPFVAAEIAAEATIDPSGEGKGHLAVVDNLCHLLSIASGTYVNWLYCDQLDSHEIRIDRRHYNRVTKQYSPLSLFRPTQVTELRDFLEAAYPIFVTRSEPYQLKRGTIASYLASKVDSDFLEIRCIKAAATMEMLKATYLDQNPGDEWNIDPSRYEPVRNALRTAMQTVLKNSGFNSSSRSDIAGNSKVRDLNRRSFGGILKRMFAHIGLVLTARELKLFAYSRNSLIHRGRFYCQTADAEDRKDCPPLADEVEEWMMMIEILDRTFLRLLGYSGSYIDWQGREHHVNAVPDQQIDEAIE